MPSVHVVGSVNLDLVATAARLPAPGETVGGARLARHPGGKGANQALAAARLGAEVTFTAAVGRDPEAASAIALLEAASGLALDVHRVDEPTGVALIAVDGDGENQIVVAPGANAALATSHLPEVIDADALLAQLEVPLATVDAALRRATGLRCLNAAPADHGAAALLTHCDCVIVNETERAALGSALTGFDGLVVTTLGAAGAVAHRGGRRLAASPPLVDVVDTVGAGDAFCGALVTELAGGADLERALAMAVTAGALATERTGAQPSLPTRADVEARCPSPC
ncbi:MAG: ribokinase [Acidimicrobiia bacterium]